MNRSMILATALLLALVAACGETEPEVTIDEPTEDATEDPTEDAPTEDPEEPDEPEPTEDPDEGDATEEPDVEATNEEDDEFEPRPGSDMEITGTLGGDPMLEGGCTWVDGDDGNRYEVMWPEGYEADTDSGELSAGGEVVASSGDELTITGQVAEGMASTCQVGTIFEAEEVTVL